MLIRHSLQLIYAAIGNLSEVIFGSLILSILIGIRAVRHESLAVEEFTTGNKLLAYTAWTSL